MHLNIIIYCILILFKKVERKNICIFLMSNNIDLEVSTQLNKSYYMNVIVARGVYQDWDPVRPNEKKKILSLQDKERLHSLI